MALAVHRRMFAALYDRMLARSEAGGLRDLRRRQLSSAVGRSLELGAGTGLNLPHWPASADDLVLTEPDEDMARRLDDKLEASGRGGRTIRCGAEDLPFEDGSFDTVAATLVLCSVADARAALGEVRRVLKPGGRFLFLEHVRSDDEGLARWQDRLNPLQRWFALGCECNRRTAEGIETAGLQIEEMERAELPGAYAIVRPLIHGMATPAEGHPR